ncbi:MAG: exodeoxyribonuclease VII small subunit [Thiothrix sp.]|nr:exodeoxyribonuclease VII small subunit [Thiothrix sp.]HPQ95247.1 exodeoxyribonuclease VII small subunit [Thiolinea sp.]
MSDQHAAETGFEAALGELEQLVLRMEGGELSLEDSLREFERGVQLIRRCQSVLQDAEQRVLLLGQDGAAQAFQAGDEQ